MFYQTVSEKAENIRALEYLSKKLSAPVKAAGGIVIKESGSGRVFVHIACEAEKSQEIKNLLRTVLADIICNTYKAAYFKQNLKMDAPCLFNFGTLIKTLVAFDHEGDKDIAAKKLSEYMPEMLALDGYFNFRLRELKDRWNTVIKLTAENSLSLSHRDIFLEFISFMLTTIETKYKIVHIYKNGDGFQLTDNQKNAISINELLAADEGDKEENLLASLIFFAPEKIVINFEDGISQKTMNILNILFDTKTKAK